jgi:hypothetical protein
MMNRILHVALFVAATAACCAAQETTFRFYDGVTVYVNNPDGAAWEATLDLRDWNLLESGPREALIKIYDPDGKTLVRKVVEDDGVVGSASLLEAGGWDHELWYHLLCYGRGSTPMLRWSSFTEPARVAALPKRTLTFPIAGGKKGVYRVLLVASRDHVAALRVAPGLKLAVAGHPYWIHGHGDLLRQSHVYVPKGTTGIDMAFAEFDQPVTRQFTVTAPDGAVLYNGAARGGLQRAAIKLDPRGKYDDQVLTVGVSQGSGDYLLHLVLMRDDAAIYSGFGGAPALFAPDRAAAVALRGGAIYHDGQVFWHAWQVRFHEWLKKLKPEDCMLRDAKGKEIVPTEGPVFGWSSRIREYKGLPTVPGFLPLNGPHAPPPLCDTLMHNYSAHKNRAVLNVALRDLATGLRNISVGDVPLATHGNLAYAFGTYGWHYWRPAWRVLQQSDAPAEVKDIVREAMIACGDRLAFARGIERVNGNAFAHIPMALRYAAEATKDPMLTGLANVYFERFATEGFGRGSGISRSGDCLEHFAHDYHYGTYIVDSFKAIVQDLGDPRFKAILDRHAALYQHLYCEDADAYPWDSRTHHGARPIVDWKGKPGPAFTVSVNGGNEWFAARRKNYYALTFHGRLCPEWMNNYFGTRLGYGGGILCQLTVPGKGTVLASTLPASYGKGMDRGNWPAFHIHALVGTAANGLPLVAADSEHLDAKLEGNTVTGSGEVRDRPLRVTRRYTFGEDRIAGSVQLADTDYRVAYGNMGPSSLVAEAWEMVPFVQTKDRPTRVLVLGPDKKAGAALTDQLTVAAGVAVDRGGYGVRIEFDRPRPAKLGKNSTVLIQLTAQDTQAEKVGFQYELAPWVQ